jgi:hypothetical protein
MLYTTEVQFRDKVDQYQYRPSPSRSQFPLHFAAVCVWASLKGERKLKVSVDYYDGASAAARC